MAGGRPPIADAVTPRPGLVPTPAGPDGPDSHTFLFTYRGARRLLRDYLLERRRRGPSQNFRPGLGEGRVRLNGFNPGPETFLEPGDVIQYRHLRRDEPPPPRLAPPLYEDPWLLALDKPDTIPVSPSGGYYFTSLAILAREHFGNPQLTPLHRLDLETGGVVLFAKAPQHIGPFHRLFREGRVGKTYRALVVGEFPETLREISGVLRPHPSSAIYTKQVLTEGGEGPLSITRILSVRREGPYSEVELRPITGKTNQLRVHLAHVGHPILGDKKYHPDESVFLDWIAHRDFERLRDRLVLPRQALLFERVNLRHPMTGEEIEIGARPGAWEKKIGGLFSLASQ